MADKNRSVEGMYNMREQFRRYAALLLAACLLCGAALPALAEETPVSSMAETTDGVQGEEGDAAPEAGTSEEDSGEEDTYTEEEPSDDTYDEGYSEDTYDEGSDDTYDEGADDTYEEDYTEDEYTEDDYTEDTYTDDSGEEEYVDDFVWYGSTNGSTGSTEKQLKGLEVLGGQNSGSVRRRPVNEETESGPHYVTFARLNLRSNSMAITLFYGGAGCLLAGLIGALLILLAVVRGRRPTAGRDRLYEEIVEAENEARRTRSQGGGYRPLEEGASRRERPQSAQAQRRPAPARSPRRESPVVPRRVSMYTDEINRDDLR